MKSLLFKALSGLKEKQVGMIWKIMRDGRESYLAGTAHFFPYSFKKSLTRYISDVDTVLIEGPLDESNMNKVVKSGLKEEGGPSLHEVLDKELIDRLVKEIAYPFSGSSSFASCYSHLVEGDVNTTLNSMMSEFRPWLAFFSIWYRYLRVRGWKYSMDLDAFHIASQMDKDIYFLEEIDEQIEALDGIPLERIVDFLKKIEQWKEYTQCYVKCYLKGDLEKLMSAVKEFPTQCESIIGKRDPILHERMKTFFEKGNVIAFVGTTHIQGIKKMLFEDSYKIFPVGSN